MKFHQKTKNYSASKRRKRQQEEVLRGRRRYRDGRVLHLGLGTFSYLEPSKLTFLVIEGSIFMLFRQNSGRGGREIPAPKARRAKGGLAAAGARIAHQTRPDSRPEFKLVV